MAVLGKQLSKQLNDIRVKLQREPGWNACSELQAYRRKPSSAGFSCNSVELKQMQLQDRQADSGQADSWNTRLRPFKEVLQLLDSRTPPEHPEWPRVPGGRLPGLRGPHQAEAAHLRQSAQGCRLPHVIAASKARCVTPALHGLWLARRNGHQKNL